MDGKRGSMCTDTGRFQGARVGCDAPLSCEAMIGPLLHSGYGYCTDLGLGKFGMTGAMRAARVAQRRAAGGVPCRLPLFYKCARPPTPLANGPFQHCFNTLVAHAPMLFRPWRARVSEALDGRKCSTL